MIKLPFRIKKKKKNTKYYKTPNYQQTPTDKCFTHSHRPGTFSFMWAHGTLQAQQMKGTISYVGKKHMGLARYSVHRSERTNYDQIEVPFMHPLITN